MDSFYTCIDRVGNKLLYRGYDENGNRIKDRVAYRPTMYVESKKSDSKYRALDGVAVEPVRFTTMKECSDFIKMYADVPSFKIYGNDRHVTSYIRDIFPNEINYRRELIDVATIDIETQSNDGFPEVANPKQEILTIAVKSRQGRHVWGMKDYDESQSKYPVTYHHYKTESAMLAAFIEWWSDDMVCPDVITGWNTRFFDLPYLASRIARVLGADAVKRLSPWGIVNMDEVNVMGQRHSVLNILGIASLDYLELFKKFALNTYGQQESYKLDYIAEVVLGENKTDYSEYGSLHELYEQNFQMFVDYNIQDVELVDRFEEKMGMLSLVFTMAYMAGVNYGDTLGTTAIWDAFIFRHLSRKNIIIPPAQRNISASFAGGYVKDVQVGMHEWVLSFDLNSLYPSIIVQWNMSPETLVSHMRVNGVTPESILSSHKAPVPNENLTLAANGSCYRKDIKGVMPELIEGLYDKRVAYKKAMLVSRQKLETTAKTDTATISYLEREIDKANTLQMAVKILLNSLYGAMGSKYFRYYNIEIAEGVTLTGQLVNQWGEHTINSWTNKMLGTVGKDRVVAGDTDSNYICLGDVVEKFKPKNPVAFLEKFASEGIEPELEKAFKELFTITNGYTPRMKMKREAIADRGIWTAKKRYILNVHNNEGVQYAEPKIKVVGIEAVKSSTPKVCRTALKEMFKIIMNGTELEVQAAIAAFKTKFSTLPAHEVAFPRGIKDLKSYADKSGAIYLKGKAGTTPIHARGALLYNWKVKDLGLENECKLIQSGDKAKFVYLKTPNELRNENVIAFPEKLPSKLGLDSRIDYDTQFQKAFIQPMKTILDAVNWKTEPSADLSDFFA